MSGRGLTKIVLSTLFECAGGLLS